MCAINPKRSCTFVVKVYTSLDMDRDVFVREAFTKIFAAEAKLNEDMRLRWHVQCPPTKGEDNE